MLYPVLRLLSLMFALVLMLTNGAAVALAMCQHGSSSAHVAARQSSDIRESSAALTEEMAERSTSAQGTTADLLPTLLVALMPESAVVPQKLQLASPADMPANQSAPPNRSTAPHLRPPQR